MPNTLNSYRHPGWNLDWGLNVFAILSVVAPIFFGGDFATGQTRQDGGTNDPNIVAGQHVESILEHISDVEAHAARRTI